MTTSRSNNLVHLLLALLLLVVQELWVLHQMDLEDHAEHASCELCIHFGHLGHALGGDSGAHHSLSFSHISPDQTGESALIQAVYQSFQARGPPPHYAPFS